MKVSNQEIKKLRKFITNNKNQSIDTFNKNLKQEIRKMSHDKIKDPSKRGHETRDVYCNCLYQSVADILEEIGLEI